MKKKTALLTLLFLSCAPVAFAQTGSGAGISQFIQNGKMVNVSEDTVTPSNSIGMPVTLTGGLTLGAVNQGSKGTIANSWYVQPCDGTHCQSFTALGEALVAFSGALPSGTNNIGSVNAIQSGTWTVGRSWNLISGSDSVSAVQSGTWTTARSWNLSSASDSVTIQGGNTTAVKVDGSSVTQPISAASLPLPTGASTSANQSTQITEETAIANSTASIDSKMTTTVNGLKVDVQASVLPTGAATSANQTTANTTLSTIATNTSKSSINTTGSGATGTVSTVTTLTAPANAVGFFLMNLDTSTANIRWAIGRTATASVGQQLQPGRDTGFVKCGANVSIVSESGTQNYDVQWISQ